MLGVIEVGGLARVMPVCGFTIGMTFRARAAAGCWKCMALILWFMAAAATLLTYEAVVEGPGESEMLGVTCCWAG
jgi:hypothetical protein